MKRLIIALPFALVTSLILAPSALADDRRCSGKIGARSIGDNVVVPAGKTCKLIRTRIDGNVIVKSRAKLVARGVVVEGNIQAENHRRVVVRNRKKKRSRIDGNIQLEQGGGGKLIRNVVDGDIQLFSNRGRFTVRRNRVDGNLQCKSNRPKPVGGRNRVNGDKENQCRRL